jgi:hypothetical protein
MKTRHIPRITKLWLALATVLVLLLLGHCFGYDKWQLTPDQPEQMSSKLDYDPKLTDPFFKTNEWSYWYGGQVVVNGMFPEGEKPPRLQHTAKCFSTSHRMEHEVRFCDTRLVDVNTIVLVIHDPSLEFVEKLTVRVTNGMFTCQYWTGYKAPTRTALIWTTTSQKLTLDKKAYRKGAVIKGRIDFECVQEATDPKYIEKYGKTPVTIKVYGVFKTIIQ